MVGSVFIRVYPLEMRRRGAASEGTVNEDISHAARQELPLPVEAAGVGEDVEMC